MPSCHAHRHLAWGMGCLLLSGCAIYDPHQVWRFQANYNTERALSVQWTGYDHLPPKTIRMRLLKWGYNVGPSPTRMGFMIPDEAVVEPRVEPPTGVLPGREPDLLEESRPPALPPVVPPGPQRSGLPGAPAPEPYGPTAEATHRGVAPTAWMFPASR